ncbi:MAG: cysteine desulfurase, partial [Magnetococcales bacterium]|nr:cysteine desulfurase [Magnetococcales bacterium]
MIYLDHNATSSLHVEAAEAMHALMQEPTGNPASVHGPGRRARQHLDQARRGVANLFGVHESLVCFTSGATEANNLAIFGVSGRRDAPGHVMTSRIEHPSVLEAFRRLERLGHRVTWLDCDGSGRISPESLQRHMSTDTFLVSIMHANNETGVIQPIEGLGAVCRDHGVWFHTDAVQSIGRLPWDREAMPADLVSLSSHKLGGPMGVGALIMNRSVALDPMLVGGGQERGRRSGTPNLPGIVGFGAVARWIDGQRLPMVQNMTRLRDAMEQQLLD